MRLNLHRMRLQIHRAPDGKLLGVFQGLAQAWGISCGVTRVVGVIILMLMADSCGARNILPGGLVAGFFYLLLALLMRPPREVPTGGSGSVFSTSAEPDPTPYRTERDRRRPASYIPPVPEPPRFDLAQLDAQLDRLSLRIQRMEAVVTDRQYDWDRRLDS